MYAAIDDPDARDAGIAAPPGYARTGLEGGKSMRFMAIMAAALCVTLSATAPATAQNVTKAEAPRVEIRFNPPLDTPLRFRISVSKTKGGKTDAVLSWVEEVRLVRTKSGYTLYWRILADTLPPSMSNPMVFPVMRPYTETPTAFDLDANGNVLRVHDWPAAKGKLIEVAHNTGALMIKGGNDNATVDTVITRMIARFEAMTPEDGTGMIIKNIEPIFGWGGTAMRVGETETGSAEMPIPAFETTVPMLQTQTMVSADPGRSARLTVTGQVDRAAMQKLMEAIVARFPPSDPARRQAMEKELASLEDSMMVTTTDVTIDLATGLPTRLDSRRSTKDHGVEAAQTTLIEWQR